MIICHKYKSYHILKPVETECPKLFSKGLLGTWAAWEGAARGSMGNVVLTGEARL